jgi:hypothetical protein
VHKSGSARQEDFVLSDVFPIQEAFLEKAKPALDQVCSRRITMRHLENAKLVQSNDTITQTLEGKRCPVCGSARAACPTLKAATQNAGMWCPELERALDRAPSRQQS